MEHHSSFLAGFLSGQRLKHWHAGAASGDSSGAGTSFYDWAANAGAPEALTSPYAYSQALREMPFARTMDGTLFWQSTTADLFKENTLPFASSTGDNNQGWRVYARQTLSLYPSAEGNYSGTDGSTVELTNIDGHSFHYLSQFYDYDYTYRWIGTRIGMRIQLKAPAAGVYQLDTSFPIFDGNVAFANESAMNHATYYFTSITPVSRMPGGNITVERMIDQVSGKTHALADGYLYLPTFRVQLSDPDPDLVARPGLLPGSPVNENTQTFTNPVTGETIPFVSCEYNFATRTYTLTLEDGNKMDVTFGDDTIKINSLGGGDGTGIGAGGSMEAMYPDNSGIPVFVPPDGEGYHTASFLSGLAAGLASSGW